MSLTASASGVNRMSDIVLIIVTSVVSVLWAVSYIMNEDPYAGLDREMSIIEEMVKRE